jgi:ABC-type antimicrobial peptide transport system permease subunit
MFPNQNNLPVIISVVIISLLVIIQVGTAQGPKQFRAINELKNIGLMVAQLEEPEKIMTHWSDYVERETKAGKKLDINSLSQEIVLETNLEKTHQLEVQMSEVIQKLEDIEKLAEELNTMTDISQMQMLQLQDAMSKQQQYLQMISSMMKSMHDAAKSIIQNLR